MSYQKLNVALMESFGALEQLCNTIYKDHHGVSRYIEIMEELEDKGSRYVDDWYTCYRHLKQIRYKRNKLSHGEVSFDSPFVEKEDVLFARDFRESIMNTTDPLSRLRRATEAKKKTSTASKKQPQKGPNPIGLILYILATIAFGIALLYFFYFK